MPAHNLPRRGTVRRAQAITTYGVGSLVAVDHESFIVSGLDEADRSWSDREAPRIHERRLERLLGVDHFRLPPASDDDSNDGLRVRRFPLMHSCPECNELQRHRDFTPPPGRSVCGTCEVDLVPSRFVVACEAGHLDEFPYWQWVHRSTDRGSAASGKCGGKLRMRTSGRTSSLRSILVSCTCGKVPEVSMEGSFRRSALKDLGLTCRGTRPWLGTSVPAGGCGRPLRTLQRGSSSVWQPVLKSALSIPPWSSGRADPLAGHWEKLRKYDDPARVEAYLDAVFDEPWPLSLDEVMTLLDAEREEEAEGDAAPSFDHRYRALRNKEYERLRAGNDESQHSREEEFVCESPLGDQSVLDPLGVTGPMLVKKLREVRALKAFTRLVDAESTTDAKEMPLSEKPLRWLPAMEVRGEGVFLRLSEERLGIWEKAPAVAARAERIRTASAGAARRGPEPCRAVPGDTAHGAAAHLGPRPRQRVEPGIRLSGRIPAGAAVRGRRHGRRARLHGDERLGGQPRRSRSAGRTRAPRPHSAIGDAPRRVVLRRPALHGGRDVGHQRDESRRLSRLRDAPRDELRAQQHHPRPGTACRHPGQP
jgi:hypothetical protein